MALVTTFATTPLVRLLYPPWYQRKLEAWKRGEIDWDSGSAMVETDIVAFQKEESPKSRNLLVYARLDSMPTLLAFVSMLGRKTTQITGRQHPARHGGAAREADHSLHCRRSVAVHAVRLVELTERGSAVMKVSELDEYATFDPVITAFRILGQLLGLAVSGEVGIFLLGSFQNADQPCSRSQSFRKTASRIPSSAKPTRRHRTSSCYPGVRPEI